VDEIAWQLKQSDKNDDVREAIRRLAARGIVDLLSKPISMGQTNPAALTQVA
jgi:hypothetical protein